MACSIIDVLSPSLLCMIKVSPLRLYLSITWTHKNDARLWSSLCASAILFCAVVGCMKEQIISLDQKNDLMKCESQKYKLLV